MKWLRKLEKETTRWIRNPAEREVREIRAMTVVIMVLLLAIFLIGLLIVLIDKTYGINNIMEGLQDTFDAGEKIIMASVRPPVLSAIAAYPSHSAAISFDRDFYFIGSEAPIRVTDANEKDVIVKVWSTTDRNGTSLKLSEKGSGVFEGRIILSDTKKTSGNVLTVSSGDMVIAKYSHPSNGQIEEIFAEVLIAG